METRGTIDIGAMIERGRLGWFHLVLLANTCLVMCVEGYDMQVASYAAPAILKNWHLASSYFGPVFGFGLLGNMLGGTLLGHLGDSIGRKKIVIAGSMFFGVFTFGAAYSTSIISLVILRFLAGCGIGASIPSAIALAVEYAPAHLKARIISFLFFGYTFGGTVGGFLAAKLIPAFGWPSVFQIGGAGPVLLAVLVSFTLPESVRYLVLQQKRPWKVVKIVRTLSPGLQIDENTQFIVQDQKHAGLPVRQLFTHGRAAVTICLWLAFVSSLLGHYFLTSWLPTILTQASAPLGYAIVAGALLQGGGGFGGIALCWLSDRKGMLFIALAYCAAFPFIVLLPHGHGVYLLLLSFSVGFFLVGGQIGLNAIAGTIYPTNVRSTGVGWALGIGRLGSIAGPVLGGFLIANHIPVNLLFVYMGFIALICSTAIFLVSNLVTPGAVARRALSAD